LIFANLSITGQKNSSPKKKFEHYEGTVKNRRWAGTYRDIKILVAASGKAGTYKGVGESREKLKTTEWALKERLKATGVKKNQMKTGEGRGRPQEFGDLGSGTRVKKPEFQGGKSGIGRPKRGETKTVGDKAA